MLICDSSGWVASKRHGNRAPIIIARRSALPDLDIAVDRVVDIRIETNTPRAVWLRPKIAKV